MTITMKDVAERAGVSIITVSRVINGTGYVHEATQAKVRAAIEELQYVPNNLARSLRSRQTSTIALLLTDITNPFWTTVTRGVEDEASTRGFTVFLCNTDEDAAKEANYLATLLQHRVDGLLIGPTPGSRPVLEQLQQQNVQFVLLDRTVEGITADVVRGDSRGGSAAITQHLLLTGRRRIAYIGGPVTTSTGRDRLAGYRSAHLAMNVELEPELVKIGEFRPDSGERLTAELLASGVECDAIFAGNNLIALGVLQALAAAHVSIPETIAVASFDEVVGVNSYAPFLTAVVQPAYEIGRVATRMLLERITGVRSETEDLVLPTQLMIRASCGCAAMPQMPVPREVAIPSRTFR